MFCYPVHAGFRRAPADCQIAGRGGLDGGPGRRDRRDAIPRGWLREVVRRLDPERSAPAGF